MNLTVDIPDELAERLKAAGASPERAVLDALRRTADDLERAQHPAAARRQDDLTGEALIAALQASPARDIDLTPTRGPLPVRDMTL